MTMENIEDLSHKTTCGTLQTVEARFEKIRFAIKGFPSLM
jgi:hypothetical protein